MRPPARSMRFLFAFALLLLARPVSSGARAGVISRLFPQLAQITPLNTATFTQKKGAVVRWCAAQARAAVLRATQEIEALSARPNLTPMQVQARDARIAELRTQAGVGESRIILLKAKQRALGLPPRTGLFGEAARSAEMFWAAEERSARAVLTALSQVNDPWALLQEDTIALLRLGTNTQLVAGYASIKDAPRLMTHATAIAARANKLERYAPGILVALDGHLDAIEPHLDDILERLDEIEPHLPFILKHLPTLAPHCGSLIKHIDALLLYADDGGKYLEPLLPYVERFAPLLDALGPHLALLRPHMRKVLPHMPVIAPHAFRFRKSLSVSANADVLVWYFGWVLRIPRIGGWVLSWPFMPRLASFLVKRLWKRPVRGYTCDYICDWEDCDVDAFTYELAEQAADASCAATWGDSLARRRRRMRGTSALLQRMRSVPI